MNRRTLLPASVLALALLDTCRAALLGFYPFDTGAGDVTGHGYNGTLSAAPPTLTTGNGGYEGEAYQFNPLNNGANNYITFPININPAAMPQVTFGAWVNVTLSAASQSVLRGIMSHDNGSFDRTLDLDTRGAGGSGLAYSAFSGSGVVRGPAAAGTGGTWMFIAARYNDTTDQLVLDVGATRVSASANPSTGRTTFTVGRNPGFDLPFSGLIDNVFVYDEWLADSRIDAIRLGGRNEILPIPEPAAACGAALSLAAFVLVRRTRSCPGGPRPTRPAFDRAASCGGPALSR
jgi:hypothetical protein